MKNEEIKIELVKSIQEREFTKELESSCTEMISKLFNKYPYKLQEWYRPEHDFIFKNHALEVCKKHALKFNPEKSDNAFAYIVQIIKSDFAGTTLKLIKEFRQNEKLSTE
jgi:hypothetical protein